MKFRVSFLSLKYKQKRLTSIVYFVGGHVIGICPKVNVIAWLEFELVYYDSAVHRFNHFTTRTQIYFLYTFFNEVNGKIA